MKVNICSRKEAALLLQNGFPKNTAVISFYTPAYQDKKGKDRLDYKNLCDRIFYIGAHDIDPPCLPDFCLSYESYLPEADALAEFIYRARLEGLDILCQCDYGQSRSAACAAAILEHFEGCGIDIFADYRYYANQMVYHKVFDALTKRGEKAV